MITIAIPFYNAEKFLADAVRSVYAQTFQDWELLLIDDGSTDRSLEIAHSLTDKRVKVFSDGKNKKLACRLNEVTKLATYDYIARMDADDMMDPRRLEIQFKILESNPQFDLVSTGMFSCSNNDEILGFRNSAGEVPSFSDLLNKRIGILHASILARKSWYERNQYNETLKLGQDTEMWFRTSKKEDLKIKIIPDLLYVYREEDNVTSNKLLRAYKNEREYLSNYIENNIDRYFYIVKSYFKTIFVTVFGANKFLLKRRNLAIDGEKKRQFEEILAAIKSVKI